MKGGRHLRIDFGLDGKKYLVTGASSGIGQAAAIKISQLGGKVVLNGRNEKRLNHTLSMLEGTGHVIMPYDLKELEGIKEFVKQCMEVDNQRFDGLVFSAGIAVDRVLRSENVESLKEIMTVNYFAYVALLAVFSSRRVLKDGGSIVAVSSRVVNEPGKGLLSYASSKAAMDMSSEIAAQELVNRKVRVNTVRPGMTVTPMTTNFYNITTDDQQKKWYPLGLLNAEDVANTIVFLLSSLSSKITGQHIYISGGNDGGPIDYIV